MATKSILKSVDIRDKALAGAFVTALALSETTKGKEITLSKKCSDLKGDSVKDFFSRNNK